MKARLAMLILACLVLAAASAQATPPSPPAPDTFKYNPPLPPPAAISPTQPKPNEIKGRRFGYSGIGVQLLKSVRAGHPLQLVNLFAPPEYGYGEHNYLANPVTATVPSPGLKIFSISF